MRGNKDISKELHWEDLGLRTPFSAHPRAVFCLYLDEEMDWFLKLEMEWKKSLPHFTFSNILAWFPEGIKLAKRNVKNEIKKVKEKIAILNDERERFYNEVINPAPFKDQPRLIVELNERQEYWHEHFDQELKKLNSQLYSIEYREGNVPVNSGGITNEMIARAKSVPISNILKVNSMGFALCPFHSDTHPSLKIYAKTNHAYCFVGCGKKDSIDIAQTINNLDFKTAVEWLNKL